MYGIFPRQRTHSRVCTCLWLTQSSMLVAVQASANEICELKKNESVCVRLELSLSMCWVHCTVSGEYSSPYTHIRCIVFYCSVGECVPLFVLFHMIASLSLHCQSHSVQKPTNEDEHNYATKHFHFIHVLKVLILFSQQVFKFVTKIWQRKNTLQFISRKITTA